MAEKTLKDRIVERLSAWLMPAGRVVSAGQVADELLAMILGDGKNQLMQDGTRRPIAAADKPPDLASLVGEIADLHNSLDELERIRREDHNLLVYSCNGSISRIKKRVKKLKRRLKVCEANGSRLVDIVQDLAAKVREHDEQLSQSQTVLASTPVWNAPGDAEREHQADLEAVMRCD